MVGKSSTTLTERRNSQDCNISVNSKSSQDSGIHLKSSQEMNGSFHQVIDEETLALGINILPDKQNDGDTADENIKSPRSFRFIENDVDQIENSPPRKSLKRSSSIDIEKFSINRKKRSSILPIQPNYFDMLSDEVMLILFTYLNKKTLVECSLVNKRWKRIAYDDELWIRIDVSSRTLNTAALSSLIERNPKYLRMSQTHFIKVISINKFLRTEYLDLSMAKINTKDLGNLLSHFNNLKKISLENLTCDLKVCKGIIQNKKLHCINMSMCKDVCEHFLKLLLTNCTSIVSFNLSWCNLNLKAVEILCEQLNPHLIHLNIAGSLKNVENEHIELLARRCNNLSELDLSDCTMLANEVIPIIINHFPKLCTLSLSRCYNISPSKYGVLLSSKPCLKYLNIHGLLHDKQIEIFQKNWPNVAINKSKFSIIARPTVGDKRTSIWGYRVRDS